ncbi:MAG: hypothetical protein RMJ56_15190 [Gemmataceae bacterium]|nr:hypothetical protein [Gemmata sp.]MDW8198941.1 hypothetical protein [Gemmataceae bacterium]
MNPTLMLSAALLTPAAPLPRDAAPNISGPAPRILAVKADANGTVRVIGYIPTKITVSNTVFAIEVANINGQQVQKQVQKQVDQDVITAQHVNKSLGDFNGTFTTAAGQPLTLAEATARLKNGATLLASADGKPIAPAWLKAVREDTVVLVAEGLSHLQPQWGGAPLPTTPAPQLVMLGTDANGTLLTPATSMPQDNPAGIYYNDVFIEKGQVIRARPIRGDIQYGYYNHNPQYDDAKIVHKPLANVKFDAYEVSGKLISRTEALRRLSAGGLVLLAGDNRLPDENYLKAFRDEILVLVSPELVLPTPIVDQTKKKSNPAQQPPAAEPAKPIQLPAKPLILQGRRAAEVILPVAPAIEK